MRLKNACQREAVRVRPILLEMKERGEVSRVGKLFFRIVERPMLLEMKSEGTCSWTHPKTQ